MLCAALEFRNLPVPHVVLKPICRWTRHFPSFSHPNHTSCRPLTISQMGRESPLQRGKFLEISTKSLNDASGVFQIYFVFQASPFYSSKASWSLNVSPMCKRWSLDVCCGAHLSCSSVLGKLLGPLGSLWSPLTQAEIIAGFFKSTGQS